MAIIPIGSLEYHGGLLPLNTDSIISSKIIDYCISDVDPNICLLKYPVLQYGFSPEWLSFSGTVSIDSETYKRLIYSILKSIEFNVSPLGFIIVNAHGSNYYPLKSLVNEYYMERHIPIVIIDIWRIAGKYGIIYCHACELEAELYHRFMGIEVKASNNIYCREIDGIYTEYSVGRCGELSVSIDDFLKSICKYFGIAVETIAKHKR
ncbi:MAG: creatininase family protein [Desulfurococcaceae archaeon]